MGSVDREDFELRRRKEERAFLVVKFMRAHDSFGRISEEFRLRSSTGSLAGSGLFERVRELAESLVFDLKEKAHLLFRTAGNGAEAGGPNGSPADPRSGAAQPNGQSRKWLAAVERGIEARSIDSTIGTAYHLLLILQESLYQIERYTPELEREKAEINRILQLARAPGSNLTEAELEELERLRALDEASMRAAIESEDMTLRVMERCETVYAAAAEVIRHFVTGERDNEVLVLNLLQNRELVERIYGSGGLEAIFQEIFAGTEIAGETGTERALSFARARCGNLTALAPGSAASAG